MDIRKIKKLMELLETFGMAEIEIVEGEDSVRISRYGYAPMPASIAATTAPVAAVAVEASADAPAVIDGHSITSPMVGTFYGSASPASDTFVSIGQHINQGDIICIVEAMKIMNQIEADQSGIVTEVLCKDGDAVEFGQTLVVIK